MGIKKPTNKQLFEILTELSLSEEFKISEREINQKYGEGISNYLKQIPTLSLKPFIFYKGSPDNEFVLIPIHAETKILELENKVFQEKQIEIDKNQERINKTLLIAISIQALALFFQVILINVLPLIEGFLKIQINPTGINIIQTIRVIIIFLEILVVVALIFLAYKMIDHIFSGKYKQTI